MINNVKSSLIRPTNVTPYTAGDIVTATAPSTFKFNNASTIPAGTGYISKALLIISGLYASALAEFRLHLFEIDIPIEADNAPAIVAIQNGYFKPYYLGYIDFKCEDGVNNGASSVIFSQVVQPNLSYRGGTDRAVYGVLVTKAAWVPVAGAEFTISLDFDNY